VTPYLRPGSLAEALHLRALHPEFALLAGGTDWMLSRARPAGVIDVFGLPELCRIASAGNTLEIGAACTHTALRRLSALPMLARCARDLGAVQIQNRGTLGGNIVTSSPVGDTLPVLLACEAEVLLASAAGVRCMPYEDFCTGYRATALRADELVTAVRVQIPAGRQYWRKVGTRAAQAISKVMVAGVIRTDADGTVAHVRLAAGAVAATPLRLRAVEAALQGNRVASVVDALPDLLAGITPIDDIRSTARYRRHVLTGLVREFLLGDH
jgi:CO/xanthine dehydrogenase FAD-binding subunit